MRVRRQVSLDAQFGRDIEWLRYEFRTDAGGTRGAEFVPVRVVAPAVKDLTLLLYGVDLYLYGWRNAHGEFHLADHPDPDPGAVLSFSSHYQSLGVFASDAPLTGHGLQAAASALSNAPDRATANRLRLQVGYMALTVPEALRQDIVAGLMEGLFSGRQPSLPRDLLRSYVNTFNRQCQARDPYIEIAHDPAQRRTAGYPPQR